MTDKGYPHPLYSLDLLPHAAVLEDAPRYGILRAHGRLVVRAELRRRAQDHSVLAVDHLVGTALSHFRLMPEAFASFGLDQSWADSLRVWRARMLEEDQVRMALAVERDQAVTFAQDLLSQGRAAFGHLALSARLAGLGGILLQGAMPKGAAALWQALAAAANRGREAVPAALLAQNGFGQGPQAVLRTLLEALPRAQANRGAIEARLRAQGDAVLVLRAALLGDAARLCQVAPKVLGEERCRALRVAALLGHKPRRRAPPQPGA